MQTFDKISLSRYLELCNLIKVTLGLYFPPKKKQELLKGILEFSSEINASTIDDCIQYILNNRNSQKMCERLASHLTVGETYFFRHPNQFDVIKDKILTDRFLTEKAKTSGKRLRFWSAACCTGEEPYSIAIMLDQLRYDFSDWDIHISGTDLNPEFLAKAKKGIYRNWSFREEWEKRKNHYFTPTANSEFTIDSKINSKVNFFYHNLATDKYPAMYNDTNALDFIFCRNTLIYFDKKTVERVIKKNYNCLLNNGWLIVAPAEVPLISSLKMFTIIRYKNVFLFQKKVHVNAKSSLNSVKKYSKKTSEKVILDKNTDKTVSLNKIRLYFKLGEYEKIISILKEKFKARKNILTLGKNIKEEIIILIKSYANLGMLEEAEYWSDVAINMDKLVPEFYYV
jgi:chemotaxis protein methyltransferase CheR